MVLESVFHSSLCEYLKREMCSIEALQQSCGKENTSVRKTFQLGSVMQTNKKIGMQTMDDSLYELFVMGKISKNTALEYSVDYASMRSRIKVV